MNTTGEQAETDLPEGLYITTFDVDKHAQAVADMWNASDANWPGTWTGGVPETAEAVRRNYERQESIATFLCMDGDVVAGFCKVMPDLDEPGVDYVALVNVPPSHSKRGLARRLLQRAIALAVERGSYRLDLHTWSANLPAVPLYKKVGFMWMPDTDLHMLNFMPAVLRLDAAREFFATREWYRVFRRNLDQVPDEDRWEDMKVFTYRFANSPEDPEDAPPGLVVRVDREARAICAVETQDYAVAATAARLDPPRGGEVTLRWTVTNHAARALPVTVVASGTNDLLIDYRGSAEVAPGATEVLEASCRIAPDAKDVKPGKPVPVVKSVLLLGGQVVELSTGLRPRPALEISTWPSHLTLLPGQRRTVQVRLRNRLADDVSVDLRAAGGDGLELSWTSQDLTAPAEGWCGAEIEVAVPADRSAAYPLSLSASCEAKGSSLRVEPDPRFVFAVAPGAVVSAKGKDAIRVENDHFRAFLTDRGASLRLVDPQTGSVHAASSAAPGPPFSPNEFRTLDYDLDLVRSEGRVEAVATTRSKRWEGFTFRRRIAFTASPLVEIGAEVQNGGTESRRVQILHTASGAEFERLVLPLQSGLRFGFGWANFPGPADEESKKPEAWKEQWSAGEGADGSVCGVVWAGPVEEVYGDGTGVITESADVAPQSTLSVEPLWLYSGPGRWQAVRDLWRRRTGVVIPRDELPEEPEPSVCVRVEPDPWLVSTASGSAQLTIEHANTWPIEGAATFVAPEGWALDKTQLDLADTNRQKPATIEVDITAPTGRPAAGLLRVQIRATEFDRDIDVPVLALVDASPAVVARTDGQGRELWTVTAGTSEFQVAPDHGGATVSWKVEGVEQFASDYPETGTIGPWLPWHGGIAPLLVAGEVWFPGRLWSETFVADEVEEKDSRGLIWRGVRVAANSTHEESRGFHLEASTLALSGAPVLKHVLRVRNETGALQVPTFGAFVFCAPGGSRAQTSVHAEHLDAKPSEHYIFHSTGSWAAAVNDESGATVLLASNREVGVGKLGMDGGHLTNFRGPEIAPGDTAVSVAYLIAAESLEAAKPWRALTRLS
ncbi:MAG TPA: GNAT family N-acetyltransferase [Acidimicrobiales bacterium]|nr:GNAT family N-acetyltransferase [Acidimicrobiales bacterium]